MKKIILSLIILAIICVGAVAGFYLLMNRPISSKPEVVTFEIAKGSSKRAIIENLAEQKIIRSKYAGYIYLFFNSDVDPKAGKYSIDKSDSMSTIIKQIGSGSVNRSAETIRLTFKEGKTIDDYAKIIAANFDNITEDDFKNAMKDTKFLESMIDKYWFLTEDILQKGIRYPLEGYLFPNTYDFYLSASSQDIIKVFLNQTDKVLKPYKEAIEHSNFSPHEILTIASIIEKEANSKEDRHQVSQVIYKRLNIHMSLGMDVTAFYGAGISAAEFEELRYKKEKQDILNDDNPYNTRNVNKDGLPIGAICNPSEESINAALNPSDGNYVYFYAVNGKDHFFETAEEFHNFIKNLKS